MGFFARYLAPELNSLKIVQEFERAQLKEVKDERDALRKQLDAEIKASRRRESEWLNLILRQKNLPPVAVSETLQISEPPKTISDEDVQLLSRRAEDYCRAEFGENYTKDQYDEVFKMMKASPENWLTD